MVKTDKCGEKIWGNKVKKKWIGKKSKWNKVEKMDRKKVSGINWNKVEKIDKIEK